jgi:hypothetical protein
LRCYFCVCILSHPCLFDKWPFLSATLFVIGTCYIDQEVSLLLLFDIVFIFYKTLPVHCIYMFFYVLKELRHLINDIKLDTVLTINKPLTKTSRAVARGKVWRFPFCALCMAFVWMEHKYISFIDLMLLSRNLAFWKQSRSVCTVL